MNENLPKRMPARSQLLRIAALATGLALLLIVPAFASSAQQTKGMAEVGSWFLNSPGGR